MKSTHTLVLLSLICSLGFTSCAVLQPSATAGTSRQSSNPKFIKGMDLGSARTTGTMVFDASCFEQHATAHAAAAATVAAADLLLNKYESVFNVCVESARNYALFNFIEEWYGVPYRMGGENKSGIDCSAFVQKLYEQVFSFDILRNSREQFRMCDKLQTKEDLEEGDLVFFRRGKRIAHVGVYLANDYFVHSSSSRGVVISSLNERYWKRNYAGAGKVPAPKDSL